MDYTTITLGQLLSSKDDTIKRNAVSILKRLQGGWLLNWNNNTTQTNPAADSAKALFDAINCNIEYPNNDGVPYIQLQFIQDELEDLKNTV